MSTYWDLHCADHNVGMLHDDWNHGDQSLALLWRHRATLLQLHELAGEVFDLSEVELATDLRKLGWDVVTFLRQHGDCTVVLRNEYGDIVDVETMAKLAPHHCPSCTCEPR